MLNMDGITHNLHYQGYARSDTRVRAASLLKSMIAMFKGHSCDISPASVVGQEALKDYCMKEATRSAGPWADKAIYLGEDLIKPNQMVGFQKWICDLLPTKPSRRLTYWFFCPKGGSGKSAIAKWLAYWKGIPTFTFAKAWDLLKLVSMEPGKEMYIINLSKTKPAEVCGDDMYNVLESIKDGNFCTYKGSDVKRILMNPPHLIVLANEAPNKEKMTQERITVFELEPLPAHLLIDNSEEPPLRPGMKVYVPPVPELVQNIKVTKEEAPKFNGKTTEAWVKLFGKQKATETEK